MQNKFLRIKEVLRERRVNQGQVAERMGIDASSLSLSINGNPTINTLARVAEAVGCDLKELIR